MEVTVSYLLTLQKYINKFKAKISEIKECELCLGYSSKDFTINNIKKALKIRNT